ncbi:hypothetical protein C2G38_2297101 [Gigaspora rosea]|uniref:CCHC-type domain-containing protein n=1 Tax=Gigaspora rosea TaxID=44941 RepID=A0A397TWR7_9GLOM|nr:hypothetical protein C2G38_2297101 [Gigaspora rosea]
MSIFKGIVCCHYFRIMMHSEMAAFHISMIPTRWYKDEYQDRETSKEDNIMFNNKKVALDPASNNCTIPMRKTVTKPVTTLVAKKTVDKRNQYGQIWGLARKATYLAMDNKNSEIIQVLMKYINKKKNKLQAEILPPEETESELESGEESEYELESGEESETMATEPVVSLVNVQNPSKVVGKGRPPKKKIISSVEKEQKPKRGKSSVHRLYKCGKCGQSGHNSAFHKKKVIVRVDLKYRSIIYLE